MSAPDSADRNRRVMLWVVAVGIFMQTLDSTIVDTALPAMAASYVPIANTFAVGLVMAPFGLISPAQRPRYRPQELRQCFCSTMTGRPRGASKSSGPIPEKYSNQ